MPPAATPVIAGYDGNDPGRDAVALGHELAAALGSPLVVASVFLADTVSSSVPAAERRKRAEQLLREAADRGQGMEPRVVAGRSAAQGLHDLGEAEAAAALVVGSSHRGSLGRVLAGSVALQLLTGSACPVAVAPRGYAKQAPHRIRTIGVGFDDGPEAWTALQRAAWLALAAGASIRIIRILEPDVAERTDAAERQRLFEIELVRATASLSGEVRPVSKTVVGDPVRTLEAEAREGLDLLVLGSRGFGPVRRVLLGSVSSELVRIAPRPVLVVPRSVPFDPGPGGMAAHDETQAGG